jgi:hypothetical protein
MNRHWHANNRMPKNATLGKRVRWHDEHARVCGSRPVPPSIRAAIEKSKSRR